MKINVSTASIFLLPAFNVAGGGRAGSSANSVRMSRSSLFPAIGKLYPGGSELLAKVRVTVASTKGVCIVVELLT